MCQGIPVLCILNIEFFKSAINKTWNLETNKLAYVIETYTLINFNLKLHSKKYVYLLRPYLVS